MSAHPIPELGPKPVYRCTRERVHEAAPTTVQLCHVELTSGSDEIVTSVVLVITTAYTAPGERILFADTATPNAIPPYASRDRRDGPVDTVLQLGRGAVFQRDIATDDDHFPPLRESQTRALPTTLRERLGAPTPGEAQPNGMAPVPSRLVEVLRKDIG